MKNIEDYDEVTNKYLLKAIIIAGISAFCILLLMFGILTLTTNLWQN